MNSVKCPRCGSWTVNTPVIAQQVVKEAGKAWNRINANCRLAIFNSRLNLSIVECQACYRVMVVEAGQVRWPLEAPPAPEGVPDKIREAYEDARLALAAGAELGALMAARIVLIRLLRDKGVKGLKELLENQTITRPAYGGVDQLRLWANVAGHEDTDVGEFGEGEVTDILDYLGTVLESVYTHPSKVEALVRRTNEIKEKSR